MSQKKLIFKNLTYLYILQFGQFIIPLVMIPYIIRTIGVTGYGIYAVAQSIIFFLNLFVDYGFGTVLIRRIAQNRGNQSIINQAFSNIFVIKLSTSILIFVVLVVALWGKPELEFCIYSYGIIISNILFPLWLFQGIEEMKFVTYVNLTARLLFLITVFIFVKNSTDVGLLCILNSLGLVIAAIVSMAIVMLHLKVRFVKITWLEIKREVKDANDAFITNLTSNLFITMPTIILNQFVTKEIVGFYSISEKISRVLLNLITPISQVIFPYLSRHKKNVSFIIKANKLLIVTFLIGMISSIILWVGSPFIYTIVSGNDNNIGIYCLRVWSITFFFMFCGSIINQIVWSLNLDKLIKNLCIIAAFLFLMLGYGLTALYNYKGICYSILIAESFMTVMLLCFYIRHVYTKGVNRVY